MPSEPWPNHLYRYLVQGEGGPVRFAWFDSATADNYGILRIVVCQQEPTDTPLVAVQQRFTMLPNVPNPFNPYTEIRYELPEACQVDVVLYDVRGRMIRRIFMGAQLAGYHSVRWDGRLDDGTVA